MTAEQAPARAVGERQPRLGRELTHEERRRLHRVYEFILGWGAGRLRREREAAEAKGGRGAAEVSGADAN